MSNSIAAEGERAINLRVKESAARARHLDDRGRTTVQMQLTADFVAIVVAGDEHVSSHHDALVHQRRHARCHVALNVADLKKRRGRERKKKIGKDGT